MTRFVLIFTLAFSAALFITYQTEALAGSIFQELLSAFNALIAITGAASFALYTYVEGIVKDVALNENNKNIANYNAAIDALSGLKKEIVINMFAVVGLLVLERAANSFSLIFPVTNASPFNWIWACAISTRASCFALSVYVAAIQFHGFLIANEFRMVISRNK